jgi:hypothetical protein
MPVDKAPRISDFGIVRGLSFQLRVLLVFTPNETGTETHIRRDLVG